VLGLKEVFSRYEKDANGDVKGNERIRLIEELFQDMSKTSSMRPKLLEIMQEVDRGGTGTLDLVAFCHLTRLLNDLRDQDKLMKEHFAIRDVAFSMQEVEEFRQFYRQAVRDAAEHSASLRDTILGALKKDMPLADRHTRELWDHYNAVVPKGEGRDADFPELLRLMRRLVDCNFADIKDRSQEPRAKDVVSY